jgi:hypothetical protein
VSVLFIVLMTMLFWPAGRGLHGVAQTFVAHLRACVWYAIPVVLELAGALHHMRFGDHRPDARFRRVVLDPDPRSSDIRRRPLGPPGARGMGVRRHSCPSPLRGIRRWHHPETKVLPGAPGSSLVPPSWSARRSSVSPVRAPTVRETPAMSSTSP